MGHFEGGPLRDKIALRHLVIWPIAALFVLTGCSFVLGGETPDEAAVDLIEGQEFQDQLDIGEITNAQCDMPTSDEVGTLFSCTADSAEGDLEFEVEIDSEDHIFAVPTNVIGDDAKASLGAGLAELIGSDLDIDFPESAVDCGEGITVFDPAGSDPMLSCPITDPESGEIYDATITITDTSTGAFDPEFGVGFEVLVARAAIQGQANLDLLNIGPITNVQCETPASNDVGTLFPCTADSGDGQLDYEVEITGPAQVLATTTNVLLPEIQRDISTRAAQLLNEQFGATLPDDAIDCGDRALVINSDAPVLNCALFSNESSNVFDATITITDVETLAFTIEVAETPRP